MQQTFTFVSGCKVLEDNSRDGQRRRKREQLPSNVLKCNWPGCLSTRTFRSEAALKRHTLKHAPRKVFNCSVVGCTSKHYRADKAREHLRQCHVDSDLVNCPAESCSVQLPRDLISIHVRNHSEDEKYIPASFDCKGLLELRPRALRPCPVAKCRKWLATNEMLNHIRAHPERPDLTAPNTERVVDGYDLAKCCIVCPLCKHSCSDGIQLKNHLEDKHLFIDLAHFAKWAKRVSQLFPDTCPWHFILQWIRNEARIRTDEICQVCHVRDHSHHMNLLHVSGEVFEKRREILKIWPNFWSHPVFDDIRRKDWRFSDIRHFRWEFEDNVRSHASVLSSSVAG
ncbi:hypothetical protein BDY21DRAFT_121141 [Lineolata rhizophorae]|uniref:C2H2-type domain-containing protein n=1 Tax=Lineolata rhizophorae TaxID=578093 RepID=A0A6A6NQ81_9PEZI|nr:hypothetical protein BDY21DRAFT_121141 [Lineolata rhizophorae]